MKISKIILGSISGTTMMTMFSYLVSEKQKKLFKEPVLLNLLLGRVKATDLHHNTHSAKGWIIHYAVGLLFTILYDRIWRSTNTKPNLQSGLILGGINGVIAVGVWRTTFKIHPHPPRIDYSRYYGHLLLAHFVFGAFTVLGYRLPELSGTRNK